MEFIKPGINLDIIGKRKYAFAFSIIMIAVTVFSLIQHGGPKLGIDFAGGVEVMLNFETVPTAEEIRGALEPLGLSKAVVQEAQYQGQTQFIVKTDASEEKGEHVSGEIRAALAKTLDTKVEVLKVDMVGPQVGKDLQEKALMAMFWALLLITVYISGRFELKWVPPLAMAALIAMTSYLLDSLDYGIPVQIAVSLVMAVIGFWVLKLQFAMGAIVALIHDVFITVGFFSIFQKDFNLPIIAALLTIIGYSLNDTIIVYDRIRENSKKHTRRSLETTINRSINETLSRTLLTSLTTLIVVISLFVLGGSIIHDFAFALLVGVGVGTYSSIYVASPILLAWQNASGTAR